LLTTQKIIQNEEDDWKKKKSWMTLPNILEPADGESHLKNVWLILTYSAKRNIKVHKCKNEHRIEIARLYFNLCACFISEELR